MAEETPPFVSHRRARFLMLPLISFKAPYTRVEQQPS